MPTRTKLDKPPKKKLPQLKKAAAVKRASLPAKTKSKQEPLAVRHTIKRGSKAVVSRAPKKVALSPLAIIAPKKTNNTSVNNMVAANEVQKQKDTFEKANKLFHSRSFGEAMKLFQQASQGPSIEFSHVARLHAKMCEQRLKKEHVPLETPDDKYNYAVSLLNQKANLEDAEKHLRAAVEAKYSADHFHYALALCLGLRGDYAGSSQHLARAIALAPNNRTIVRNDPDFREILQSPAMRALLAVKPA